MKSKLQKYIYVNLITFILAISFVPVALSAPFKFTGVVKFSNMQGNEHPRVMCEVFKDDIRGVFGTLPQISLQAVNGIQDFTVEGTVHLKENDCSGGQCQMVCWLIARGANGDSKSVNSTGIQPCCDVYGQR